ncbi:TNXB [Branchiostoma lanceolatum]|uniref:TNXB protein n=1 Tax=Branchiostoma lanceolatum TaxID=7740 RepID=A0A8J9VZ74_BRALA|nr:TNXB [Branchiostoma lanceolatum]
MLAQLTKSVVTMGLLWRRVFLSSLLLLGLLSGAISDDIGGSYYHNHTLSLSGSPYNVTNEIIVGETATLTIEAGVRLLFAEGVGMTVWGRLIAVGTPEHRIVFDRKRNPPDDQANNVTRDHDIRLLGPTVFEGRVQVKRNGTWGSLCLQNSWDRWRSSEATVVCRHLGFATGRVEDKYRFGRGRMAVCDLECLGNEDSMYECNHDDLDLPPQCGQGRYRRDLGVVCDGLNHKGNVYWKAIGIRTTSEAMKSTIQNVNIFYAGGANYNTNPGRAAIISTTVPPRLHNVNIKYSADAAIRVYNSTTTFRMENCDISENHGVGLIVKNPSANVTISSSTFSKNFPVGMQVTGGHTGSTLQITDSTFEQNSGAGLMLSEVPMNVDIRQSNFSTNSHYGLSAFTTTHVNLVTDSCHFDHNGLDGFHARYRGVSGDRSRTVLRNGGAEGNVGSGFDLEIEYHEYQSIVSPPILDQIIIDQYNFASNANGSVKVTVDNSYEDRFPVVQLTGGIYQDNMATIIEVGGTHAEVTVQDSEFDSSQCGSKSVIHVHGFDKTVNITGNRFVRNVCRRVVLFNSTDVSADFHPRFVESNMFENNAYQPDSLAHISDPLNEYCTIEIVGSGEEHTITQNSFLNSPTGLELCSSDGSHPLAVNQIRAENNWWGITDINSIKEKIFDNNDWYSGSEIKFSPYLDSPSGSPINTVDTETMTASSLGGRLNGTLRITTSDSPVTLTRDLTILPDSVLSVEAGVEFRVQERVGILNLGKLQLDGLPSSPITFDVTRKTVSNRTIPVRLTRGYSPGEGLLEVQYSGQWVPVCHDWYSEFATIACRQLGLGSYKSGTYSYYSSYRNWITIRCDGSEDNIGECSLYHTSRCGSNSYRHLRLTCDSTPGWGGIVSFSNQTFEPHNINLLHVGHMHRHKTSGLLIQGSSAANVMNNVIMKQFVGTASGIEYLHLQPSQRITLENITLINSGSRDGTGIHINNVHSMSWWELEVNAAKRLVWLDTMCGGPASILLQEGQPRWIVNGIKKRTRLRCHRTVKAPDGYYIRVTVTKTDFSYIYPSSRNSLNTLEPIALNETNEIASLHYRNQISQSGNPRVFTSDGSTVRLLLQASRSQNAFFLAKFDVIRKGDNGFGLENPASLDIIDLTARNFRYGIQVSSGVTNVHIDRSTLSYCVTGLHVQGVGEGHISVESTVASQNSNDGIYISSLLGSVTLSNVSVVDNLDDGIYIYGITGTVNLSHILCHSNNDHGMYIYRITGTVNMNDIVSHFNSDNGIYIFGVTGEVEMSDILSHSNYDNGIYIYGVTGEVEMSDILSHSNYDNGIYIYGVTSEVEMSDILSHSNYYNGIYLRDIGGSAMLTDVVASGNGPSYAGINIYHSNGQGQYKMVNVTCQHNRGKGISINVHSEEKIEIRTSLVQGNDQGGIFANFGSTSSSHYSGVILHSSELLSNKRFALHVKGKQTSIDIANSTMSYNSCPYQPAVGFEGETKDVNLRNNFLVGNNARETLSFLFGDYSQGYDASKIYVVGNIFRDNSYDPSQTDGNFQYSQHRDHTSCSIEIGGYKPYYALSHNMLDNPDMNYTMCSRISTTSPDETIDARYNWWGSAVEAEIREKISDFDDWNDRAPVDYFPYLTGPDLSSPPADPSSRGVTMTTDNIGGRLYHSLNLRKDRGPYIIQADLTVFENASLTIDPGSIIKVPPCVGLLNLGSLVAQGTRTEPIFFELAEVPVHQPQVRLVGGRYPWEGRVEVFYDGEWGTVCGRSYWDSGDANVVCRELGYGPSTEYSTYSFGQGSGPTWIGYYSSRPDCTGNEMSIFNCLPGTPGNVYSGCTHAYDVGIRCNMNTPVSPRPICRVTKWGGITSKSATTAVLTNLKFSNTGNLHGRPHAAISIQEAQSATTISNIEISECVGTGIQLVGKTETTVKSVNISRCNGYAGVSLAGRRPSVIASTNVHITDSTFTSGSFELTSRSITDCSDNSRLIMSLCTTEFDLHVNNSICFKETGRTSSTCYRHLYAGAGDTVELIVSSVQFQYYYSRLWVYADSSQTQLIGQVTYWDNGKNYIRFVSQTMMSLRYRSYYDNEQILGEVTVGPTKYIIENNMVDNTTGTVINVSEMNGAVIDIQRNMFLRNQPRTDDNEQAVVSSVPIDSYISVRNNYMANNLMKCLSIDLTNQKAGNITVLDNHFLSNTYKSAIMVTGDSYSTTQQPILMDSNVFSSNNVGFTESIVKLENVDGQLDNNVFFNNSGKHVVSWEGRSRSTSEQMCENNLFYDNIGQTPGEKYTVVVSGRDVQLHGNVLTNPANDAELATPNRAGNFTVNATLNWWGFNSASAISSRIRDGNDREYWAEARFEPWIQEIVADGPCGLGWTYSKTLSACYRYMGGSQSWDGAVQSCQAQYSVLSKRFAGLEKNFIDSLLIARKVHFAPDDVPVWIDKGTQGLEYATTNCQIYIRNSRVAVQDVSCNSFFPYICKRPVVDECPNSCSHHGLCEGRTCICGRGWEGKNCSQFHCKDRNYCGEFGTCVGPNVCRCRNGWQGRACTVSYCNRFTSCRSCSREVGCGWCEERQRCESGLYGGPDVSPCNMWFYHSCFTVDKRDRCSGQIEVMDCEQWQCNPSLSTTTVESCLRCQDIEGCFKELGEDYCNVWNEDQCPKGFIHPLYNDTTRIEKILVGHNVEYVPLEDNILYRCPVRLSSWGATMFVNEGELDIRIGQVLSSPQANGVLHKVEQVIKTGVYTMIVAHPATLEDMLDYSDFSQEVQLEMAVDMKRNEGVPELSVVERVLSGNETLDGSNVRVIMEDASVYKCIGARAMNEGEGSYHLLMRDTPDHLSVGDVIVSNHSNGILERVIKQTTTARPHGVFIQTKLQDCFTSFNLREELETTDGEPLQVTLPCSGGPDGTDGLLVVNAVGKEVDLEPGDVVVGRRSGRLLAKVMNITLAAEYTLVEVKPILSSSTMTMPSRRRREDVTVSDKTPLKLTIEDNISGSTDNYTINLSTSGKLRSGIKLSLAVWKSEFQTPTLKKAEAFFIGGQLEVGLSGSLDVFQSTQVRSYSWTELSPRYVSLYVSETLRIPAKIWAHIVTSYEIYAEGPGSIQMSSNVVKPDIDGGGSWQPQEGGQRFTFTQNEESDSANIVISSYSGTATESDQLITFELTVRPTFFIEFPTAGESEEDTNVASSLEQALGLIGQDDAFGYSITTSIESQALLRVSAQSCSAECPYSNRPQYVGVTSSLDYLKGAYNVIAGNKDYYQEQAWTREEWMDSDRDCKEQMSSIDTCRDKCSCTGGATGKPHPTNEEFCMCPCNCESGNTSFTHPDLSGNGCNCDVCPDGDFKTVNNQGNLHCPCLCPDNRKSELTSSGICDCSCTCADGSRDVVLSDGTCPCRCTCNNCHESVLGPQGCICSDSCPDCENDEEPEWQDCVCKCPQKTECGIPPTCVVGRRGPDCRQPDCRPCQGCSGNGRCTTSTDSCPSSCACSPQWFGDCCELRRPRPIGGDPHLQTLDGLSFDYHGIGEFWDCKSVSNDFGVQTRMYAYESASLIGGVAVKAGHSIVTLMTSPNATEKNFPYPRIDGELRQLSVGEKYLLNNGTIHLLAQQPSTNATESGAVIIISLTFASGATVSFDVRYSPKMGRQFVNILFSPTATFKGNTEGLCGLMDDDDANDFTGPDGAVYNDSSVFAETWRINNTHHGSGLMGSWSWNSSNFHPDDVMDPAYSDPDHRPSVGIDGLTQEQKEKAEEMCIALGLTGTLLNECIFDVSITNDTTFTEQEVFKGCPNQCSGRGRCVNGTCDCITGWSGEDCNLGNCTDCSEDHGRCELGFCVCEPGWEGPACDQEATCHAVNNCTSMDHGICVSTDVCRCKPGYIGEDCSKVPTCGNVANCTDHGICVDFDICLCDEQWTGDNCDQFSCAALDHCSGKGICVDIDVCFCEQGWTGSSCVTPDCPVVDQCSRQGDCIGPNICQCYSGYQGLNCEQVQSCPELQECNENGACVINSEEQKECRCFPGFSGASCDHPDCTEQNNCTNHGTCIEPNLCQCDSGYTGNDCSNFSCEALRYCSGHGSCVGFDTCSCDPGWSGGSCDIANCSSKAECSIQGTCVAPNTCECFPGFQGEDCSEENLPNEHPPIFQQDRYDVTIPENQPVGSSILTVFANDTDSGRNGEVRYRLDQTSLDDENFAVHPTLGIIASLIEFDFESLEHTSFSLVVEAYDQGLPTLTGTATITINVTDQNDNKPVINIPPDTEYNLQSTSPIGFHVTTVQASDNDRSDDNSKITYGIPSVSPFVSIDTTNGSVTVSGALESGTYVVRVSASDRGSPPKTDEISLRLIVTKVSTNTAPQCPEDQSLEIFSHNLTRGSTVATIEAEDRDNGPNGEVSYSFKSTTGELESLFSIDPSTGRIYVQTEVPQFNDSFSAVSMTVEVRDNAVDSMYCETNVVVIMTSPEFSGTVPDNVFPTTTPLATTSEPQKTTFHRSTAGSTTQPDLTAEESESSTTIPTTKRATTTEEYEITTPFDRSTTGPTTQLDLTTEETESTPAIATTEKYEITASTTAKVDVHSFRGVITIVNRDWKDELRDQASDTFKTLAAEVHQELDSVFINSNIGDKYDSVQVNGFSPGSIKVDFMVRFNSSTPIASDTVLAVLSGRTDIGGLQIDHTVTSITEVNGDGDVNNVAWYDNPLYILVTCVGAAVVITAIVVLVICCAAKRRERRRKYPVPSRNERLSENARRRRLAQQHMLIPRAWVSREPMRQMYQNPVYNVND